MTIPTAGSHPDMLEGIVETCGLPRERIIIIRTKPDVDLPSGCIVVDDFEPPNIQRWWTRGIDESVARGASAVAVLNDDLRIEPDTLERLHDELLATPHAFVGLALNALLATLHALHLRCLDHWRWSWRGRRA